MDTNTKTNTINSSKIDISTITSLFQELIVHWQVVAQEVPPSERQKLRFKTFSFQKAIKSLQNMDTDYITAESLEGLTIPSVGKGIKNRISEIIETGSLQELVDNTSETEKEIVILTDPVDATKLVTLAKGDVDEMLPSKLSLMPDKLLNTLNKDEVLDLLAFLKSRGNPNAIEFK